LILYQESLKFYIIYNNYNLSDSDKLSNNNENI
jgi:hypothetical protein